MKLSSYLFVTLIMLLSLQEKNYMLHHIRLPPVVAHLFLWIHFHGRKHELSSWSPRKIKLYNQSCWCVLQESPDKFRNLHLSFPKFWHWKWYPVCLQTSETWFHHTQNIKHKRTCLISPIFLLVNMRSIMCGCYGLGQRCDKSSSNGPNFPGSSLKQEAMTIITSAMLHHWYSIFWRTTIDMRRHAA